MSALLDQMATDWTDCFLRTAEFGVAAVLNTQALGDNNPVTVEFNEAWLMSDPAGVEAANTGPACLIASSFVVEIQAGDTIIINSTTYYLLSAHPDGHGVSLVILSTTAPPS